MALEKSINPLGRHFTQAGTGLGAALDDFLAARPEPPRLLGLGEPMHGVEAFPLLRNQVLRHLVSRHGYRAVAIESDCLAGLAVNDYVTGERDDLDEVLATGFSHGFGDLPSNRELLTWLREHNEGRDPHDQVRFYGFDAPMEMTGAPSPRIPLAALHDHLTAHLSPSRMPHDMRTIDALLGEEAPWTDPAAMLDPARCTGSSAAARELRVITDDLLGVLETETPGLLATGSPSEHERARLFARTAQGLLRYHAVMADSALSAAERMSRMMGIRDAMMAGNLQALAAAESGPTLVFAHNQHLRRDPSTLRLGDMDLRWWSGGAGTASRLGSDYAVIASYLGTVGESGITAPGPDTVEGVLLESTPDRALFPAAPLSEALSHRSLDARSETPPEAGYFSLAAADLDGVDAIAFISDASSLRNT